MSFLGEKFLSNVSGIASFWKTRDKSLNVSGRRERRSNRIPRVSSAMAAYPFKAENLFKRRSVFFDSLFRK
jgi:hypothetical protein